MNSELEARLDVHIATEEGEFKTLHMKLDALTEKLDRHIEESEELTKALRGGLIKLAFMVLGAAIIGGWKWVITKIWGA